MLALKVGLVYYPGHLATAIHFSNDVRGTIWCWAARATLSVIRLILGHLLAWRCQIWTIARPQWFC